MNGSVEFSSVQASGVIASHPLSSSVSIHGADSNSANNFKKRGANPVTELAVPPALSPFKVADANVDEVSFTYTYAKRCFSKTSSLPAFH